MKIYHNHLKLKSVSLMFCCESNHPKIQWLKRTIFISQWVGLGSVCLFSEWSYLWSHMWLQPVAGWVSLEVWEASLASHGFILRWAGPGFYILSVLLRVRHPKPQFRRAFHISIGITFTNIHPSLKSHRQARIIERGITRVQALPSWGHHSNSLPL